MAGNVYMQMTGEAGGPIAGSSTAKGFEKWIEVVSWSHGFSQPTTAATKSVDQQATSRANHADFQFAKFFDAASDDICKASWTGAQMKQIVMKCYRASGSVDVGSGATEYLTITMDDVIISHYSLSGGGDELPIENITLNYTKIMYSYNQVDFETGKAGGKPVHITHDLSTNVVS